MLALMAFAGIVQGEWQSLTDAPAPLGPGAAMAEIDGKVYVLRGGGTSDFWRYDVGRDTWTVLPSAPFVVDETTPMTADGFDIVVAAYPAIHRYVAVMDRWIEIAPLPAPCGDGGCIVPFGAGFVAARGGGTNEAWRFGTSGELQLTFTLPTPIDRGGSMRRIGSSIHVLPGRGNDCRYTLSDELIPTSTTILQLNQEFTYQAAAECLYVADGLGGTILTPAVGGELKPVIILPDRLPRGSFFGTVKGAFMIGIGGTAKVFRKLIPSGSETPADDRKPSRCSASAAAGSWSWAWFLAPAGLLLRRRHPC